VYEIYANGSKVSDELLAPGWTNYSKRLQYQTYDLTDMLRMGDNGIGIMLGDGWYRRGMCVDTIKIWITETVRPVSYFSTPASEHVLDMGQNMVGRNWMKVRAPEGTVITIKHAEVLDNEGNIHFGEVIHSDMAPTGEFEC